MNVCIMLMMFCVLSITAINASDSPQAVPFDDVPTLTAKNFDALLRGSDVFVMFYAPWCGHCKNLKPTWEQIAAKYQSPDLFIGKVDCTKETDLCSEENIQGYPTLLYYKVDANQNPARFSGARTLEKLDKFIQQRNARAPEDNPDLESHVYTLNNENFYKFIERGDVFVVFYAPWCEHCKKLKPIWQRLGHDYSQQRAKVRIAKVDCTENTKLCSLWSINAYPTLKYLRDGSVIYDYKENKDLSSLKKFVDAVLTTSPQHDNDNEEDGMAYKIDNKKSVVKAEPVLAMTASNYEEETTANKLLFIKFYAPWCSHCKKLAPVWEELGQHFIADESVAIAKIDCTKESAICSAEGIKGYPTLALFNKGKRLKTYDGERSLKRLIEFVNSNKPKEEL